MLARGLDQDALQLFPLNIQFSERKIMAELS